MWTWLIPVLSLALLVAAVIAGVGTLLGVLCGAALIAAVIVAVHHAEVVAHRVGEPFGTLVLALAVTAIETGLILSMMIAGGKDMAVLPRDSIYAAVMIICNRVVGICVLFGGVAHREQTFRVEGAGVGIGALIVMSTVTLVLPVLTTSRPGGTYSTSQLAFVAVTSAVLWAIFIFIQTVRHRDYFIPVTDRANMDVHAEPPTTREACFLDADAAREQSEPYPKRPIESDPILLNPTNRQVFGQRTSLIPATPNQFPSDCTPIGPKLSNSSTST